MLVGVLLAAAYSLSVPATTGNTLQTVTFALVSTVALGVSPITLTATASSGLTTFTYSTASAPNVCTVSANKLMVAGVGTCSLTARHAGNATYASASATASIEIVANQSSVSLIAVQSRKTHGSFGPFDTPIESGVPVSGAISIEPRLGNVPHNIVFQFSGPVISIGPAIAYGSPPILIDATPTILGSEVSVALTGIPDNQRVTTCLSAVNGTLTEAASIGFLAGDVNGTRNVNAIDIVGTKARRGNVIDATNFFYDLNGDGQIDALDLAMVKSRSGRALPIVPFPSGAPQIIYGPPPTNWGVNATYSFQFSALGSNPITWTIVSGSLPPGLTLNSITGLLNGIPTTPGVYSFAVQVANCNPPIAFPRTFTITIWETDESIPTPSKIAGTRPMAHAGLNGAGALYAWPTNAARCDNTQPAISASWQHNIDFDNHRLQGQLDFFDMAANEALTYAFYPFEMGSGNIFLGTSVAMPLTATFLSISTKPCDFDIAKLVPGPNRDYCYVTAPADNALSYSVTNNIANFSCKLVPGTKYYLNLRWQNGAQSDANTMDSCALAGLARCGGYLQIR